MIACAPTSFAICTANIDTPPVPSVSTVSIGPMRAVSMIAFHAVTPAHGSVAASRYDIASGNTTSAVSGSTTSSDSHPSTENPIDPAAIDGSNRPSIQLVIVVAVTRSATLTRDTPSPTAITSPAPSESGPTGSSRLVG